MDLSRGERAEPQPRSTQGGKGAGPYPVKPRREHVTHFAFHFPYPAPVWGKTMEQDLAGESGHLRNTLTVVSIGVGLLGASAFAVWDTAPW